MFYEGKIERKELRKVEEWFVGIFGGVYIVSDLMRKFKKNSLKPREGAKA